MKSILIAVSGLFLSSVSLAQSSQDLIDIKEQTEHVRMMWNKKFEEGVDKKNFSELPALRKSAEAYMDGKLSELRRANMEGDERPLLVGVKNYVQINRQFVRDVMIPAESLNPGDQDGIDQTNRKISEFGQKEKIFLLEINSAIANSGEPGLEQRAAEPTEEDEALSPEAQENKPRRAGKLPHETGGDEQPEKPVKKAKEADEDDEDEE